MAPEEALGEVLQVCVCVLFLAPSSGFLGFLISYCQGVDPVLSFVQVLHAIRNEALLSYIKVAFEDGNFCHFKRVNLNRIEGKWVNYVLEKGG